MNIMLGNMSVAEIERRLGIEFPDETREFMNSTHQESAMNIGVGEWHCFDMPFRIVCGDRQTAEKIYYSVANRSSECKEILTFGLLN